MLLVVAGCTSTTGYFLPEPIPLGLDGGALVSQASVDDSAPFSVVVDTGSPVTVWDDGLGKPRIETGKFRFFDVNGLPRLELDDVRLYASPLDSLGPGAGFPIGGVLGGDNLQRWVLALDYRGAGPMLTLSDDLTPCNCELANACQAVFPFTLAGGGQDRPLSIGSELVSYPATRILLDVCLEPYSDPVSANAECAGIDNTGNPAIDIKSPAYLPSGIEARLIVATGFPGFALSSSVFNRLRNDDSAAANAAPVTLHLPDAADGALAVGAASIGRAGTASLVIVERQGFLGPCGELARSRRQRRSPVDRPRTGENGCFLVNACDAGSSSQAYSCNDTTSKDHVSALLEIDDTLPTYIVPDTAPILVGINADVRPGNATVDGIVGTEVLQRFLGTIDYPGRRLAARCVSPTGCLTYPAYRNPGPFNHPGGQGSGCGHDEFCVSPADIPDNGGLCDPLP